MMVPVSNYNLVKNVLAWPFARRLRENCRKVQLCCRDREDLFIIAFAGVCESKEGAY
ncbi:hypothetical protein ACHUNR_001532 [Raoultella planticola]